MRIGRSLGIGVLVLLVIVVGAVIYVASSLDSIVAAAIEKYGSQATQTPVRVSDDDRPLLCATDLVKYYGKWRVVSGVSLDVRGGEVVGLLGPNGAGKTTTFYMIVGLHRPNGGQIALDGHDVTRLPMYQRARLGIGYLPQESSIFRKLNVRDNIMGILETLKLKPAERRQRYDDVVNELKIGHLEKRLG